MTRGDERLHRGQNALLWREGTEHSLKLDSESPVGATPLVCGALGLAIIEW